MVCYFEQYAYGWVGISSMEAHANYRSGFHTQINRGIDRGRVSFFPMESKLRTAVCECLVRSTQKDSAWFSFRQVHTEGIFIIFFQSSPHRRIRICFLLVKSTQEDSSLFLVVRSTQKNYLLFSFS